MSVKTRPPTPRDRYKHKPTRKQYLVIAEADGICILQGIDFHPIEVSRAELATSDAWERQP